MGGPRRGLACTIAARRLILALIVLLVLSSAAAALVPVNRDADSSSTSTTSTETSTPTGKLVRRTLDAGAKEPETIRIHDDDELALQVRSPTAGQIEIDGLGELAYVDRDTPARFDLLPFEPGTYRVDYVVSDEAGLSRRAVGRIVVRGGGGGQEGASPIDSPGDSTTALTPGALLAI